MEYIHIQHTVLEGLGEVTLGDQEEVAEVIVGLPDLQAVMSMVVQEAIIQATLQAVQVALPDPAAQVVRAVEPRAAEEVVVTVPVEEVEPTQEVLEVQEEVTVHPVQMEWEATLDTEALAEILEALEQQAATAAEGGAGGEVVLSWTGSSCPI